MLWCSELIWTITSPELTQWPLPNDLNTFWLRAAAVNHLCVAALSLANAHRKSYVKWGSCTGGHLFEGKREWGEEPCWWVAKLNILSEEMSKLISCIKATLPCFAYVVIAPFYERTTVEQNYIQVSVCCLIILGVFDLEPACSRHHKPAPLLRPDQTLHLILALLRSCCWNCKPFGLVSYTSCTQEWDACVTFRLGFVVLFRCFILQIGYILAVISSVKTFLLFFFRKNKANSGFYYVSVQFGWATLELQNPIIL